MDSARDALDRLDERVTSDILMIKSAAQHGGSNPVGNPARELNSFRRQQRMLLISDLYFASRKAACFKLEPRE